MRQKDAGSQREIIQNAQKMLNYFGIVLGLENTEEFETCGQPKDMKYGV